jgi:hypothetical protein
LTSTDVPWTTSPFVGESRVIFTGDDGRLATPPTGVGYGVGAGVPEDVGSPGDDEHAVMPSSAAVKRTSNGRRIVQFPAHLIMSGS